MNFYPIRCTDSYLFVSGMNKLNRSITELLWVVGLAAILLCSNCRAEEVEWQILTKLNYSSQILLHPHLLLIVTVPWSGESRSLMKELANELGRDQERLGTLKLRVLYQNAERMLADAIGAGEGITVLYYHNSISYKYSGKLRVQNLLSSVHYVLSLPTDELPLKTLTTPEELGDFLDSTDKAVLLFEFCGWTPKLMSLNKKSNGSTYDFVEENNVTHRASELSRMKDMENDVLAYGTDIGLSAIAWSTQFSSSNGSVFEEVENSTPSSDNSCSIVEFKQLESFLSKFVEVARESILPPERVRFAYVRDRSLLASINIDEPNSWIVAVHFSGCRDCLKVVHHIDGLKSVLKTQHIPELEDDQLGVELPTKRPTMLLFIDRSSDSIQIRKESREALNAFRQLVQHYGMPDQKNHATTPIEITPHPRLQPLAEPKRLVLKDKMSIVMINEGQQFTLENLIPDLQGSSVQEILTYALKRKKELKLSSLAKEAGFQLLSKDYNVEVVESSPHDGEAHSVQLTPETPAEAESLDTDANNVQMSDLTSNREHKEPPISADVSEETTVAVKVKASDISSSAVHIRLENHADDAIFGNKAQESDHSSNSGLHNPSDDDYLLSDSRKSSDEISSSLVKHINQEKTVGPSDIAAYWKAKEMRHSGVDEDDKQKEYNFSFFIAESQYRLLRTLTGGSTIPSVVIIDPFYKSHYVLTDRSVVSYSSLVDFVSDFSSGLLHPFVQSASTIPSSRESLKPPFVNMDFRQADAIPRVTAHAFTEVVVSSSKSDSLKNSDSCDKSVMVLFSNGFCGFCQRMELVVREVYRAIKEYANKKMNHSRNDKLKQLTSDIRQSMPADDDILKLPLIYMMDCTQNDCSFITKPITENELYPLLVLFPGGKKNESIIYEGGITVSDIIKFLAAHGSHVLDLFVGKPTLQVHHLATQIKSWQNEVLLKDQPQKDISSLKHGEIKVQFPTSHEKPQVFAGCTLTATEKLQNSHPFDASKILILKADPSYGFLGLIINKRISWESLDDLGKGFEFLNEATLSFGGPVLRHGMPFVALTQKFVDDGFGEILPNVYFVDQLAMNGLLEEIKVGNQSAIDYWFFLGYSKWGWEQLFLEIAQGAWNVREGDMEQLEWPLR